jgi:hypothetical protein
VNFYSGPGTGKSTVTAHVFALLKWRGRNVEMALEYAKDKVWENSLSVLQNQIYVLGKQLHRVNRLVGQVDIVLTDAPLGHSLYYGRYDTSPEFKAMVLEEIRRQNSINIFLERTKPYNPAGRYQTAEEAVQVDREIRSMLEDYSIPFFSIPASQDRMIGIADLIEYHHEVQCG